jgi:VanZ family protein
MTEPHFVSPTRILPVVCLLLTAGLLSAGLSPFNPFPKNRVSWVPGGGLEFNRRGIVYGAVPLPGRFTLVGNEGATGPMSCGLQIRIQPKVVFLDNSGTILNIYALGNPQQFRLMQWRDQLLVRREHLEAGHPVRTEMDLANAFIGDEPVTFTIIAMPDTTVTLRNGQKVESSSKLGLSCADFGGELSLGNEAIQDNPWSGKILDVEFFRIEAAAPPSENAANPASAGGSAMQQRSYLIDDSRAFAHYRFKEGSGKVAHGEGPVAPDLFISKVFVLPHKELLLPPWRELEDKLSLQDITVNIVGLMPFGFLVFAYFFVQRRCSGWRAALITISLGFLLSTTIEVVQAYIPSRTSGVLDIIDNTLGTALGAWLFHWRPLQILGSHLRLYDLPDQPIREK